MSERILLVLVTVPNNETARTIAETLLTERLAACVNILPGIESHYHWNGAVEHSAELLLLIKTTDERVGDLSARVSAIHPYEVPEIVALDTAHVNAAYSSWVRAETAQKIL